MIGVVRGVRALAWIGAAAYGLQSCVDLRYALMHQDTAFQQTVASSNFVCWLLADLIVALAADRCLELLERALLGYRIGGSGKRLGESGQSSS